MSDFGGPKLPKQMPTTTGRARDTAREEAPDEARLEETLERLRAKQNKESKAKKKAVAKDGYGSASLKGRWAQLGQQTSLMSGLVAPTPASVGQPGGGRGIMNLRLANQTGGLDIDDGQSSGAKGSRTQVRLEETHQGRVAHGDLVVEKLADLEILRGVIALDGDLEILESPLSGADLSALSSLQAIGGSLNIEGNRAVDAVNALAQLRSVEGNVYAGFNDALTSLRLPNLSQIGGSLILEGNLALTSVELPGLTEVGGYLHLHENDVLERASFTGLNALGAEISILDNPQLVVVEMPGLASCDDVEVASNGTPRLEGLALAH